MPKEYVNPPTLPDWSESFSQVVVVRTASTKIVYVSGQVSVDRNNNVVGHGDLGAQANYAVQNLGKALAAVAAQAGDVVRLGIYIKDYRRDQSGIINKALAQLFDADKLPASTWLGVTTLALDELLIEIEATAVVEEQLSDAAATQPN